MQPEKPIKSLQAKIKFLYLRDLEFRMSFIGPDEVNFAAFAESIEVEIKGGNYVVIESQMALFNLSVIYNQHISEGEQRQVLFFQSEIAFQIANFDEIFFETDENSYESDPRFASALSGIALSTIRGILIEKTANSIFKRFPLPIIDPGALDTKPVFYRITQSE